jgi:phosphoglycerate dehydrogenase-like enzyme
MAKAMVLRPLWRKRESQEQNPAVRQKSRRPAAGDFAASVPPSHAPENPMPPPLILFDAWPRTPDLILDAPTRKRFEALGEIVVAEHAHFSATELDRLLPEAAIIMGETDLPAERLARAPKLKAIFNISGNFGSNVDYGYCQAHGIYVLTGGTAFAVPVAESALAMGIDLARGISRHDREFHEGRETWFHDGTRDKTFLFSGAPVGIIGYGDLGRALRRMLTPFRNPVKVYDPWVAEYLIESEDCTPTSLADLLATSKVIFVFASPTTENQHFLGREQLLLIQKHAAFVLMSRAAVVDFDELVRQVGEGRFNAAVDVFPLEPMPRDHPVRRLDGMLLSGHRTGGMTEAFHEIGRLVVGDAEFVLRGLPPQLCRRGDASVAGKFRDPTKRPDAAAASGRVAAPSERRSA